MNGHASAVFFDKSAFYATYERKNKQPHSSVTRLIQLLTAGRRGNDMGGSVIYTTQPELSEMDLGMAQLFQMPLKNEKPTNTTKKNTAMIQRFSPLSGTLKRISKTLDFLRP
jgi:hypothetical protein